MITTRQLIEAAPFTGDKRTELLSALPTMSFDQKGDLKVFCWELISQWYRNRVHIRKEDTMHSIANGTVYSLDELKGIQYVPLMELIAKMGIILEADVQTLKQNLRIVGADTVSP
jgi:hypothetical protein